MAVKGVDILILVEDPGMAGTYITVGGQRGATLSETNDTIETTHKLTNGAKTFEYSFYSYTISCDGVYILSDAAYTALVNAMRQKTKVKVRWSEEGTDIYEGTCLVVSRDLEGAYDAEATYSMELQGDGNITTI